MKVEKSKLMDFLNYFIVFFLIYISGGFAVAHRIIPPVAVFIVRIVLLFIVAFANQKGIIINKTRFFWYMFIGFFMVASSILNLEDVSNELTVLLSLLFSLLIVSHLQFNTFKIIYSKLMYVITLFSLVIFVLYVIFPQLNSINVVVDLDGNTSSYIFLFNKFTNLNRNCAFFWEPGVFQTFIILAMIFEFSFKKLDIKRIIVFFLGLFSTFSTTAFIVMVLFGLLIVFNKRNTSRSAKTTVIALFLIAAILVVRNYEFFFSYNITSTTFGKILHFFDTRQDGIGFSSASVRIYSVIKPIEYFIYKPLFGWGYEGLKVAIFDYTHGINTCTFVNYFAVYGLIFGIVMIRGYVGLIRGLNLSKYSSLIIFVILFFATGSENYVRNSFFLLITIFGNSSFKVFSNNAFPAWKNYTSKELVN